MKKIILVAVIAVAFIGCEGTAGINGIDGRVGNTGERGATGNTGAQGEKGNTGDRGLAGISVAPTFCISDSICGKEGKVCIGYQCRDRSSTGQACEVTDDCVVGLHCFADTNICNVAIKAGEVCENNQELCIADSFCIDYHGTTSDARCHDGLSRAGCIKNSQCRNGLQCSASTPTSNGICNVPGGACSANNQCTTNLCNRHKVCECTDNDQCRIGEVCRDGYNNGYKTCQRN